MSIIRWIPVLIMVGFWSTWSAAQGNNTLTPEEERDGYELLFNGENVDADWRTYESDLPPSSWRVVPGEGGNIIEVSDGDRGHLVSKKQFRNFDLKIDWLVPSGGNSGIFIRYLESEGDWAGNSGPEAQVVDVNHRDGKQPKNRAGVCYDMFELIPGTEDWASGTDKWNEFRIIAFEKHVVHYGNGIKITEYEIDSPRWTEAYRESKYSSRELYGDVHAGSIYLQHHGERGIKYRNIRIRDLGTDPELNPWREGSPHLNLEGTGLVAQMPNSENINPQPVVLKNLQVGRMDGLMRLRAGRGGIELNIPVSGSFHAEIRDLHGSLLASREIGAVGSTFIPLETAGAGVVSVRVSGEKGLLAARRVSLIR